MLCLKTPGLFVLVLVCWCLFNSRLMMGDDTTKRDKSTKPIGTIADPAVVGSE